MNRMSIYSREEKELSFQWRKCSNGVNLPPDCWLVTLRNGAISGALCWSLLLADLAFSSNYSQVSFGDWQSMLLRPCIFSVFATMASLLMSPLGNGREGWGERLTVHRTCHSIYLFTELICCLSHFWWELIWTQVASHSSPIWRIYYFLPRNSFSPSFPSCSFQALTI